MRRDLGILSGAWNISRGVGGEAAICISEDRCDDEWLLASRAAPGLGLGLDRFCVRALRPGIEPSRLDAGLGAGEAEANYMSRAMFHK